jgi:hypothetical protein
LIALDDPTEATSMLRGMMIMEPQRATVLGQREPPGADEIAARGTLREAVPGAMRGPPAGISRETSPNSIEANRLKRRRWRSSAHVHRRLPELI